MKSNEHFRLEKSIWTDHDFDVMGWHDVHVHGIAFKPDAFELYFDIDYIFAWIDPEPPDKHYTFWVAPCTWVFSNVYDIEMDVGTSSGLEIADVSRELVGRPKNADFIDRDQFAFGHLFHYRSDLQRSGDNIRPRRPTLGLLIKLSQFWQVFTVGKFLSP